MTQNTRLLLNSSAMLALAVVTSSSLIPITAIPREAPELIYYHQRRTGRNKGEKKRNKAIRWG